MSNTERPSVKRKSEKLSVEETTESSGEKKKGGKLSFKGDKGHKKKKRKADDTEREVVGNIQEEGWVPVETLDDLVGPLFLTFPSEPPTSLSTDDQDRLLVYPLPSDSSSPPSHPEPTIVQQVFVGARIVGSPAAFSLKSSSGRYLTSDRFGAVTADREAIGAQEEWNPAVTEAGVAWQSAMYGKFLAVDEIAGGGYKIRADAESVGFYETWRVLCQARFKKKLKIDKGEVKKAAEIEVDNIKKFQSWGAGRLKVTNEDLRDLKHAKRGGTLAEAMLDRREKIKADRYCK